MPKLYRKKCKNKKNHHWYGRNQETMGSVAMSYSMVVGVATNSCLRCQTALVAHGIATSPRYLY
jgi:hypothetical protein